MSLRLIWLVLLAFESYADCSNIYKELSPGAIRYKSLTANKKNNVIQKFGVNQSDYPDLVWRELKSFEMDDLTKLDNLSISEYQKNSIRDLINRLNENVLKAPDTILENTYSGYNVGVIGKPEVHITILADSRTNEVLGIDYSVTIKGAELKQNHRGSRYFVNQQKAALKGADINSDVSWNLGGGTAEIDFNKLKVIEDDFSITWTGY